jgi:hypothetical protein
MFFGAVSACTDTSVPTKCTVLVPLRRYLDLIVTAMPPCLSASRIGVPKKGWRSTPDDR